MKALPIWDCSSNPFETEDEFTKTCEEAEEISLKEFIIACDVEKDILSEMIIYWKPSFSYWRYKYWDNEGYTYFYIWSAIEFFYQ